MSDDRQRADQLGSIRELLGRAVSILATDPRELRARLVLASTEVVLASHCADALPPVLGDDLRELLARLTAEPDHGEGRAAATVASLPMQEVERLALWLTELEGSIEDLQHHPYEDD